MDVFYYDAKRNKSVIAYPENCQSCGQCYLACPTDSLTMVDTVFEYSTVPMRGLRTFASQMPKKEEKFGRK
jgi:ferredoxin